MATKYHRREKKKSVWVGDKRERRKGEEKKKEKKKKKKKKKIQSCLLKSSSCFCRLAGARGSATKPLTILSCSKSEPNTLVTLILMRLT